MEMDGIGSYFIVTWHQITSLHPTLNRFFLIGSVGLIPSTIQLLAHLATCWRCPNHEYPIFLKMTAHGGLKYPSSSSSLLSTQIYCITPVQTSTYRPSKPLEANVFESSYRKTHLEIQANVNNISNVNVFYWCLWLLTCFFLTIRSKLFSMTFSYHPNRNLKLVLIFNAK